MIVRENRCSGCDAALYPCIGDSCDLMNCRVLYCDLCKDEVDKLYIVKNMELCADCALKELEVIE